MTDRKTNSYEYNFTGTRCRICTGCGRCAGGAVKSRKSWDVVTADLLKSDESIQTGACDQAGAETEGIFVSGTLGERLAVADLGTTTIAMQLFGTDGSVETDYVCVNPQVCYGADVLSRIAAAQNAEDAEKLRRMVTEELTRGLVLFRGRLKNGEHLRMVLAGNTTMIYLLMGYDPQELGRAPFHATHLESMETEIDGVRCGIFPGISAFVGGDIVAGICACGLKERENITLLIDLGTNGEMVLGNRTRSIACATAAGPAFEGGVNRGIWGSDMVHFLALLREREIIDESGLLAEPYFEEGVLVGSVRVTQQAIRAIQLAKGAIGAGIRILMKEYGIEDDFGRIDRVVLAGGFGYYLRPQDAAKIGILPAKLVSVTRPGGNTSLAGALKKGREWLACGEASGSWTGLFQEFSNEHVSDSKGGADPIEVLNLAEHPDFEKLYLENMDLRPDI